jgi:modification methylase
MNTIYNEDCLLTMDRQELSNNIDLILTSPPYNTSRIDTKDMYNTRYDKYKDKMTDEEYINWTIDIFNGFDKVLKKDRCVLYNMSYSSENTHLMWLVISEIIKNTKFTTADCIIWKKNTAIPNNRSKNKLTRIVEYIFVFVRKSDLKTFETNKKVVSVIEKTGQNNYENIYNLIEAKNNDGSNKLNKAVFSTELVTKLMNIYGFKSGTVYDPFIGIGTTALGAIKYGMEYVGSELSLEQIEYFNNKMNNE